MDMEDNKKRYLEKIIHWFVDDTVIDYDHRMWLPTFLQNIPDFTGELRPLDISRLTYTPSTRLYNHCRDTYGLNNDEIDYIWDKYSIIIIEKIENVGSINESVDRKNDYLDKVVDFLMDDTEVGTGWFNPPYYIGNGRSTAGRTGFKSVYLHTFGLLDYTTYSGLDSQLIYFNSFCKNNYGLTEEETKIVWERYMKKLYESYNWGF